MGEKPDVLLGPEATPPFIDSVSSLTGESCFSGLAAEAQLQVPSILLLTSFLDASQVADAKIIRCILDSLFFISESS